MPLKTVRPHHVENRWVLKCRIHQSIERPIDLVPAPPGRITKFIKVMSVSGSKNIGAVGDDRLKWEQNEGPDVFLPMERWLRLLILF